MNQHTQIELVKRALAHVDAGTTDTADASSTVDVAAYLDPARYEREIEVLFRGGSIAIGHTSRAAEPGQFFTHDHAGVPLLISRDRDRHLRAHLNVCRHRGTRVEDRATGCARSFVCPYHGWTYGVDGRLAGVPHRAGFAPTVIDERGLAPVPVAEAAGLIWVRPRAGAAPVQLDAALGSLAGELDGFGLTGGVVYDERTAIQPMSWKLAIDIFLETYHIKRAHTGSIYRLFFDNIALVDRIGPHLRCVIPKRTIAELDRRPEAEPSWQVRAHANILYHLFPNTLVLIQPDHAVVSHVFPDGPARCIVHSYLVIPEPATTDKARAHWDANADLLSGTTDEDFAMGASIQRGLASGANRELVHGAFEHALAHFHAEVARRTAGQELSGCP